MYLTTHYSGTEMPVFNPFGRYLLWKRTRDEVDASPLLGRPEQWHLGTLEGQAAAFRSLVFLGQGTPYVFPAEGRAAERAWSAHRG